MNITKLRQTIQAFIEEECRDIHYFMWEDSIVITNWHGKRRWVDYDRGLKYVKMIVQKVREENLKRIKDYDTQAYPNS